MRKLSILAAGAVVLLAAVLPVIAGHFETRIQQVQVCDGWRGCYLEHRSVQVLVPDASDYAPTQGATYYASGCNGAMYTCNTAVGCSGGQAAFNGRRGLFRRGQTNYSSSGCSCGVAYSFVQQAPAPAVQTSVPAPQAAAASALPHPIGDWIIEERATIPALNQQAGNPNVSQADKANIATVLANNRMLHAVNQLAIAKAVQSKAVSESDVSAPEIAPGTLTNLLNWIVANWSQIAQIITQIMTWFGHVPVGAVFAAGPNAAPVSYYDTGDPNCAAFLASNGAALVSASATSPVAASSANWQNADAQFSAQRPVLYKLLHPLGGRLRRR
jgi:hypothetical protein